ncbi:MAG: NUDIX hydrolase [Spirochaetaceae bacterium]
MSSNGRMASGEPGGRTGGDAHLEWTEASRSRVFEGKIFDLHEVVRRARDGREGRFVLVESPDWANVVTPVRDAEGREYFVMVRQYRQGSRSLTLEFPGGIVDEGEEPEAAAWRELVEETGYVPERLELIGTVNPNPAFMSNTAYTFLAHGAHLREDRDLDPDEIMDTHLVPVEAIVHNHNPEFHVHAIMVSAVFWYERWLERAGERGADGNRTRE